VDWAWPDGSPAEAIAAILLMGGACARVTVVVLYVAAAQIKPPADASFTGSARVVKSGISSGISVQPRRSAQGTRARGARGQRGVRDQLLSPESRASACRCSSPRSPRSRSVRHRFAAANPLLLFVVSLGIPDLLRLRSFRARSPSYSTSSSYGSSAPGWLGAVRPCRPHSSGSERFEPGTVACLHAVARAARRRGRWRWRRVMSAARLPTRHVAEVIRSHGLADATMVAIWRSRRRRSRRPRSPVLFPSRGAAHLRHLGRQQSVPPIDAGAGQP
jgi:hypothetical protein